MSDEILNSKGISSIRFRMAKPQGYFTEDIEAFVDGPLKQTLAAYELKTSQQESTITRLENRITELDSKVAELELRNSFQESSMNVQSDDALMASLEQQERLEKENQAYKVRFQELEGELAAMRISLNEKDNYAKELDAYIDKIQPILQAGSKALQASGNYQEVVEPQAVTTPQYEELQADNLYAEDLVEEELETVSVEEAIVEPEIEAINDDAITVHKTSENFDFFNLDAEIDLEEIKDELDEALAKEEAEELEEYDVLPDGTKVPKGIRPEDL
jgi:uncharacterized coiled-coil protein SlyX